LLLPPRDALGWFTRPGDCDAVADWLQGCAADRLVISLEMLCFGGLVASRTPAVTTELALERLEGLRQLRRRRPELTIFAFSIVMRLGTTVTDAASLTAHQAIQAYSQLVDRLERLGEESARRDLEAAAAQLGFAALSTYLSVRRRNHTVNSQAIGLAADGVIDYLVLAQEDSAPVGIHLPELLALRSQVEEHRLSERVAIHPGADEVGLVLLARHHNQAAPRPLHIGIHYASDEGAQVVPRYEHQPIIRSVESQVHAAGARLTPPAEADAVLFIHTPLDPQGDIAEAPVEGESPALAAQAEGLVEQMRAARASGAGIGLADLAYANGADPELIAALRRNGVAAHLDAFAAWNTAGNTLGTVISQLCHAAWSDDAGEGPRSGEAAAEAARDFIACRLIDDWGYQSCVRQQAAQQAQEMGANPFVLGGARPEIERLVCAELKPLAHLVYSDLLGADAGLAEHVRVSLPWGRLFEVEVEVELDGSGAPAKKRS
jgi:hypothetical protein